ncbi:ATP-binding protein [candidate division KSB1 bacterium]|nr:ATP-binding protein [candidate division KSB1 bacterium]RQW11009.1 MAG: ATP-binding protein [candidate division KSB1 bacterium]
MYIYRKITPKVLDLISYFPVVGIIGPRQVGKTTLAKELMREITKKCIYIDLELPEDFNKLNDPQIYLEQHEEKCVILDEIQRMPNIFSVLRALVDRRREPGRFVILGSASPDLLKQSSETLAGRIAYSELSPFNLTEIYKDFSVIDHWFKGGFPEAFLSHNNHIFGLWMRNFVQTYLERDLQMLGLSADSILMRRLWTMIAHYHGGIWNASTFAKSLGITVPTVNRYLNFLEAAFLVHRLDAHYFNIKKRLVKSPKIYIRDTGILHYLAGINNFESLQGHPLIGNSWEGYAIEQIHQMLPSEIRLDYYRTHHGAESDLVLTNGTEPMACIEIKYSSQPKLSKGFQIAIDDLKTSKNFIITPKSETYLLSKTILACSLADFLQKQLAAF